MQVESKSLITKRFLIFILRLLINTVALRGSVIKGYYLKEGGAYFPKRRVIHMKFENFGTFSFQINVNNNHYDILDLYIPELLVI